jgi:hypothetical protein
VRTAGTNDTTGYGVEFSLHYATRSEIRGGETWLEFGQSLSFKFFVGEELINFSHTSRPALGPTQLPVQWVPDISRG